MEKTKLNRAGNRCGMHMKGRKFTEEHKNNIRLGRSKPICQFDKGLNFIKLWPSTRSTNIRHCGDVASGKRKSAGGFLWKWLSDCSEEDLLNENN